MDGNQILKSDYLDILFQGRNKQYGSYELRKKYPRRMLIAGLIVVLSVSAIFAATMVKFEEKPDAPPPKPKEIVMAEPPPINENKPPPPPPPPAPPPVRPTVKFTPPVIKPNEEVREEEKPEPPKPKENVDVGIKNEKGSDDPNAVSASLGTTGGTGTTPTPQPTLPPPPPDNTPTRSYAVAPKASVDVSKFLRDHIRYPQQAIDNEIQGTVVVEFVVNLDGTITDVKAKKALGGGCSEEAVRVVKQIPKWTPGRNAKGDPIRVIYQVPVSFKLQQ